MLIATPHFGLFLCKRFGFGCFLRAYGGSGLHGSESLASSRPLYSPCEDVLIGSPSHALCIPCEDVLVLNHAKAWSSSPIQLPCESVLIHGPNPASPLWLSCEDVLSHDPNPNPNTNPNQYATPPMYHPVCVRSYAQSDCVGTRHGRLILYQVMGAD